ncbi:MAG: GxxExxY protein [Planctomycetes bacterium]|nr:GxxExxY protein [Planctomycetota bacterium]
MSETKAIPHQDLIHKVVAAANEVHAGLGPGFNDSVYEEALAHELTGRGLQFHRQAEIPIIYKDMQVGRYSMNFIVENAILVELRAETNVAEMHNAQVLSYLKTTKRKVAILINFNTVKLKDGIKIAVHKGVEPAVIETPEPRRAPFA